MNEFMKTARLVLAGITLLACADAATAQSRIVQAAGVLDGDAIVVSTPPVHLEPMPMDDGADHGHMAVFPPLVRFTLPVSGYVFGVEYELVDREGREVPRRMLHHFNIIDPEHREMFLPISRRIFAAGQETGSVVMPKSLAGIPFEEGDAWILSAMLHNPTGRAWDDITLRVRIRYVKKGLPWPLAHVIPFQMDTLFPTGDKAFDLPPGHSVHSWEGQPVTEGRIVAIGSHLHDLATEIRLEDVTEGQVVWTGKPVYDDDGRLERTTRGEFYGKLGVLLDPERTYRVTVEYDNPTGENIPDGGMGVIAGVIIPSDPDFDFAAQPSDSLYVADEAHFMRKSMNMDDHMDGDAEHEDQ
jgi:hypothetical protein